MWSALRSLVNRKPSAQDRIENRSVDAESIEDASAVAESLDAALRSGQMKLQCPACKGDKLRYMKAYDLWACQKPGCGEFISGPTR